MSVEQNITLAIGTKGGDKAAAQAVRIKDSYRQAFRDIQHTAQQANRILQQGIDLALKSVETAYIYKKSQEDVGKAIETYGANITKIGKAVKDYYLAQIGKAVTGNAALEAGIQRFAKELLRFAPSAKDLGNILAKVMKGLMSFVAMIMGWGQTLATFFEDVMKLIGWIGTKLLNIILYPLEKMIQLAKKAGAFFKLPEEMQEALKVIEIVVDQIKSTPENIGIGMKETADSAARRMGELKWSLEQVVGAMNKAGASGKKAMGDIAGGAERAKKATEAYGKAVESANKWYESASKEFFAGRESYALALDKSMQASKVWEPTEEQMAPYKKQLDEQASGAEQGTGLASSIQAVGSDLLGSIVSGFSGMITQMFQMLKDPEKMTEILGELLGFMEAMFVNLMDAKFLNRVINSVVAVVELTVRWLAKPGVITQIVRAVVALAGALLKAIIPNLIPIAWELVKAVFSTVWDGVKWLLKKILSFGLSGGDDEEDRVKYLSGGRAAGGLVFGGQSYLVGERGPEIFKPRTTGMIVPNDQVRAAASPTVNISVNTMDARSFGDFLRGSGGKQLVDWVRNGGQDSMGRTLQGAIYGSR